MDGLYWCIFVDYTNGCTDNPTHIYVLKVNNGNTRMCEIYSKLTKETPERRLARTLLKYFSIDEVVI